jgi:Family of unknown function (DUF6064)
VTLVHPPFSADQFFDVFRRYNDAVWPAQFLLLAIGLVAAAAAYRANARRSWRWAQVALTLLAILWLWAGVVYHKAFFTQLTEAGEIYGRSSALRRRLPWTYQRTPDCSSPLWRRSSSRTPIMASPFGRAPVVERT